MKILLSPDLLNDKKKEKADRVTTGSMTSNEIFYEQGYTV